jgi:type IV pilus assembly protein PilV
MMAIAVFAIGVSGIIAMQKVAAAANQHSRALSLATNIAQAWQDQLNADASLYTRSNGFINTVWLAPLANSNQAGWFKPAYNTNLLIGAAFDGLGQPLTDTAAQVAQAQFCVHLRLTRLYPTSPGIDVVRTEVRVIWPRTEGTTSTAFCDASTSVTTLGDNTINYHFLYQVSAVRQQ